MEKEIVSIALLKKGLTPSGDWRHVDVQWKMCREDMVSVFCILPPRLHLLVFQSVLLTGIVCPPCKLLMAACASAWLENLTKAQPVYTEKGDKKEGGAQHQGDGICGEKKHHLLPLFSCYLIYK